MCPVYDHWRARDEERYLLTPHAIIEARERAVQSAREYVHGVDAYCKELASHLAYVQRNVEWDTGVTIHKRKVAFRNRNEYVVEVRDIPTIRGECEPIRARTKFRVAFSARSPKKASLCFLDRVSFAQPRYLEIDTMCTEKVRHYANTIKNYRADTIRDYPMVDVINLACDNATSPRCNFFDVEAI